MAVDNHRTVVVHRVVAVHNYLVDNHPVVAHTADRCKEPLVGVKSTQRRTGMIDWGLAPG